MSYPTVFTTPGVRAFAEAIDTERQRQLAKWGEQHHPDVETRDIPVVTHHYYAGRADIWRQVNEERATPSRSGRCVKCPAEESALHTHTAWDGVLLEEVYEALAEDGPDRLRAELVQVAAVCAAWIADIDSRTQSPVVPAAAGEEARYLEDGSTHTVQALTDAGEACVQQGCVHARVAATVRQEQYSLREAVNDVLDEVGYMADDGRITAEVSGELRRLLRDALDKPLS